MSARYRLTPLAEEDFAEILYGIAEITGWSRNMDEEDKLYETFRSLALNPASATCVKTCFQGMCTAFTPSLT